MDILQDSNWTPLMTLEKLLRTIQVFLHMPLLTSPSDAVNEVAAKMFSSDPIKFQTTAR